MSTDDFFTLEDKNNRRTAKKEAKSRLIEPPYNKNYHAKRPIVLNKKELVRLNGSYTENRMNNILKKSGSIKYTSFLTGKTLSLSNPLKNIFGKRPLIRNGRIERQPLIRG